jgi:hypothetical protein
MMTLLPAQTRPAAPWKNGKGVTREIAIFPPGAGLDNFDWRVSIADVSEGGAFSHFPGIDRQFAVLDGTIILDIAGEGRITLGPKSDPVAFPGDVSCSADIPGGAARDLNVMTRRGRYASRIGLATANGMILIPANASTIILVALCDLSIRIGKTAIALKALDAVRFEPPMPDSVESSCDAGGGKPGIIYVISLFEKRIAISDKASESPQ